VPVAVVTGASRGIGAGIARVLAARGFGLGLLARSKPALGRRGEAPDDAPVISAALDVRDPAALEDFATAVVDELGPIDLWVNNAGVLEPIGPLADVEPDALRAHVETNVLGVLYGSRACLRVARATAHPAAIVNMSSGAAETPYAGWAAYCASKAAVDQLTRVVALEGRSLGVRAWSVAPGVVDTRMQELIRSTDASRFPAVGKFLERKRAEAFNSPEWVGQCLIELVFGSPRWARSGDVVVRLPDQPKGWRPPGETRFAARRLPRSAEATGRSRGSSGRTEDARRAGWH
jgi:benzil reductase ((S)-benzoin forming)